MSLRLSGLLIIGALVGSLASCAKEPTRHQSISDNRPQVMFEVRERMSAHEYTIYIDNLRMGTADQYQSGENALRILSGTHILRIERGGQLITEQRIYLTDGTTKVIRIP
ncbi:MAG: hypothetical protein JJU10_12495 [Idiomarina sp.]|nr:hypothetical protein [Idiomarina sp.]